MSILHTALSVWDYDSIEVKWNMNGKAQAYLNEGINALKEGSLPMAVGQLTAALDEDTSKVVPRYFRAVAYKKLRKLDEAKSDINQLLLLNPDMYEAKIELGKVLLINREVKLAAHQFETAVRSRRGDPRGYYFWGLAFLANEDLDSARIQFKKCLMVDSLFVSAVVQLAAVEVSARKDIKAALPYVNRALSVDSLQRDARSLRYLIRVQTREFISGLDDINFLLRYDPINLPLKTVKAYLLIQIDRFDEAFKEIKYVLNATNVSENHFVGKQTNIDRRIDIQNAGSYLVSKLYGLDSLSASIIRKAYCYLVTERYSKCIESLASLPNAKSLALAVYMHAVAVEHIDKYDEADRLYAEALKLDNEIIDAHKKRAIYLTRRGEWSKAISEFDAAQRLNPETAIIYKLRGVARYNVKDFPGALRDFSRYLESDTADQETFHNRAMTFQAVGRPFEALRDCAKAKDYQGLDFSSIFASMVRAQSDEDSVALHQWIEKINKIPDYYNLGTEYEMVRVYVLLVEKKWDRIDYRFIKLGLDQEFGDHPHYISLVMTARGVGFVGQGDFSSAEDVFSKAIKYNKRNSLAYYERGNLRVRLKKDKLAIDDFSRAADLGDKRAALLLERSKSN